jgi:hypothetical protein
MALTLTVRDSSRCVHYHPRRRTGRFVIGVLMLAWGLWAAAEGDLDPAAYVAGGLLVGSAIVLPARNHPANVGTEVLEAVVADRAELEVDLMEVETIVFERIAHTEDALVARCDALEARMEQIVSGLESLRLLLDDDASRDQ